jgi:hypothetical protein
VNTRMNNVRTNDACRSVTRAGASVLQMEAICKIGRARNAALEAVEGTLFALVDYFILLDSDMCRQWALSGFAEALRMLRTHTGWSGITANGVGASNSTHGLFYVDWLGWRHAQRGPASTIITGNASTATKLESVGGMATRASAKTRLFHVFDPAASPIEIGSAFGGLAIYRRSAIAGCRFLSVTATDPT